MEKRGEKAAADWSARVVERYDSELAHHFDAEERLLFPAVLAALGPLELVAQLIAEHRRMESLVAELRRRPDRDCLEEFLELLRAHIRREENEFFELIQAQMPPGALDAVAVPLKESVIETGLNVGNEEL